MPEPPEDSASENRAESISGVFDFYDKHLIGILAASQTHSDKFPKEILNEIRSAFTHLSRANKASESSKEYGDNVKKAYGHLTRACLDCYKTRLIYIAEDSEKLFKKLSQKQQKDVFDRRRKLMEKRRSLSVEEGKNNPTEKTLDEYAQLTVDYKKFENELRMLPKEKELLNSLREHWLWLLIGATVIFVAGALAGALYPLM